MSHTINEAGETEQVSKEDQSSASRSLEMVESAVSWAYDAALNGVPGSGTLEELVESYSKNNSSAEAAIDSLISWQIAKAGTAGFVTGLGGIITLPAAIPLNLASVLFIQFRLIAAIAKLRGYDVRSDQVKAICIACLAGSAVADILKDVGIKIGTRLTQQAISKIAGATLVRINQAVGFRLVTKAGSSGLVNLTKMVPFVGGIIGGAFDAVTTNAVAHAARTVFTKLSTSEPEGECEGEAALETSNGLEA